MDFVACIEGRNNVGSGTRSPLAVVISLLAVEECCNPLCGRICCKATRFFVWNMDESRLHQRLSFPHSWNILASLLARQPRLLLPVTCSPFLHAREYDGIFRLSSDLNATERLDRVASGFGL